MDHLVDVQGRRDSDDDFPSTSNQRRRLDDSLQQHQPRSRNTEVERVANRVEDLRLDITNRMASAVDSRQMGNAEYCASVARAMISSYSQAEIDNLACKAGDMAADVTKMTSGASGVRLSADDLSIAKNAKAKLLSSLNILYFMGQASCTLKISSRMLRDMTRAAAAASDDDGVLEGAAAPPPSVDDNALAAGVSRFLSSLDSEREDLTKFQQLLLYVLNVLYSKGYKRYEEDCYEPRLISDKYETYSWKRVCSIKEFVYSCTRKEVNFEQWLNLTQNKGNAQGLVDHLVSSRDVQFPELVKDRHLHSFRNGVYITRTGCFGEDDEASWPVRGEVRDRFISYTDMEDDATRDIPSNVSACRYHDRDFPEALAATPRADWRAIPTPNLDSIMSFQGFEEDVCSWFYALVGRMLYATGETDGWQVMPYLKGQASSGKSTILLGVCRNMFDPSDVGVLSNNIERKFGISQLAHKLLFIAPEIKSDLQLEQAEFQSMVSGEAMQPAVKNHNALAISNWRVPGIMAGNEVPGWVDNSGSIGRRMIVFGFTRRVVRGDTELGKKLDAEMPVILLKCNRAYLEARERVGADNIWVHLPEYFDRMKQELTEATNPVQEFMNSGQVVTDAAFGIGMPLQVFKKAYQTYCGDNGISFSKTSNTIKSVLESNNCIVQPTPRGGVMYEYPRGSGERVKVSTGWVTGVDLDRASSMQQQQQGQDLVFS